MSKSNKSDKFLKLVGKHKETKKESKFKGTLGEYLPLLEVDPGITKLAHKRLYDSLLPMGLHECPLRIQDVISYSMVRKYVPMIISKENSLEWKDH